MDVDEIIEMLSNFSNLEEDELYEEISTCIEKIAKIGEDQKTKQETLKALEDELEDLQPEVDVYQNKIEEIDVQLIRIKTARKRLVKHIGKLKSLNATCAKVEVRKNDKLKLAEKKVKLSLMTKLLKTFINSENNGYVINPVDLQFTMFHLNPNDSKLVNRKILWKNISQCSRHNQDWEQLFQ